MPVTTDKERIAALEVRQGKTDQTLETVLEKLDELLAIRNKGVGAFWLASSLLGTGIIGTFMTFFGWAKHGA